MKISQKLNIYMEEMDCSGKELAEASGLSASVISRYRKGERQPAANSEQLKQLSAAIRQIATQRGCARIADTDVYHELNSLLVDKAIDTEGMSIKLNALISLLEIPIGDLARFLRFDPSYISKIRAGQRVPADAETFAENISRYVVNRYGGEETVEAIARLIECDAAAIGEAHELLRVLKNWLCAGDFEFRDDIANFLLKLDDFNLNEFIKSMRFNEIKIPSVPFLLPTAKQYYGLAQMRAGEIDFFKATVLSKSMEDVFMCSDMPMEDMAEDPDFPKKWMYGIAMVVKKGLHLNMVHYLDRPFAEMMLGLESWVPLYMSGQISPYYMRGTHNKLYNHLNYASGAAALCGDGVSGRHDQAKYYLTKKKRELEFYRNKAALLLERASPLMDIYRAERERAYRTFRAADAKTPGERTSILTSPPLYTMDTAFLAGILRARSVPEGVCDKILALCAEQRSNVENILADNTISDKITLQPKEEFARAPICLSLSDAFYEDDIFYTYDEYAQHIRMTEDFERAHPNYNLTLTNQKGFHNIQILIHQNEWAMVSKSKFPAIHFVIRHPKLRDALENVILPVVEE